MTAHGHVDVVARARGERWWVCLASGHAAATSIGVDLKAALVAALLLLGIDAEECHR